MMDSKTAYPVAAFLYRGSRPSSTQLCAALGILDKFAGNLGSIAVPDNVKGGNDSSSNPAADPIAVTLDGSYGQLLVMVTGKTLIVRDTTAGTDVYCCPLPEQTILDQEILVGQGPITDRPGNQLVLSFLSGLDTFETVVIEVGPQRPAANYSPGMESLIAGKTDRQRYGRLGSEETLA